MKKTFNVIMATVAIILLSLLIRNVEGAEGVRARLFADENVQAFYTVDETHTFIIGELPDAPELEVVKSYRVEEGPGKAYMVTHQPEQVIYKNPVVPPYEEIGLQEKEFKLSEEDLSAEKGGYTPIDLYQHLYAVCKKGEGTPFFVIPKKYGNFKRLTLVEAGEAFEYILLEGSRGAWYMACEGVKKFVVLKDYAFMTGGQEVASVGYGRTLDGINYVKDEEEAERSIAMMGKPRSFSGLEEFLEDTVKEVSALGTGFVRPYNGSRYEGKLASSGGCDLVSIGEKKSGEVSASALYEYRVCKGVVAKIGEKVLTAPARTGIASTDLVLVKGGR